MTNPGGADTPWSNVHVDHDSGVPLWLQLKTHLEDALTTGTIPAGTQLPSVRTISQMLGVSVDTIRQTYEELRKAGLVTTRHGAGTFTTSKRPDLGTSTVRVPHNVITMVDQVATTQGATRDDTAAKLIMRGVESLDEHNTDSDRTYVHAVADALTRQHGIPIGHVGDRRWGRPGWFIEPDPPTGPGPDEQDGWLIEWNEQAGWSYGKSTAFGYPRELTRLDLPSRPAPTDVAARLTVLLS